VTPKLLPFNGRASIKAAIVLQPLLGITNFLQIVNSPYGVSENMPILWGSLTCKTGRCAPPALLITASLILPAKLKIQYVEKLREKSQFGKEGESAVQLSYCHIV
jgi:hypothetical protein